MFEEGFSGKETFDAKFEGGKEVNHVDIWGKNIQSRIRDPEWRAGQVCLRHSEGAQRGCGEVRTE